MSDKGMMLTKDDLKELVAMAVATAIAESKKPAPMTLLQESELAQSQAQRKEMADSVKDGKKNARYMQERICTHEHLKSAGGGTHSVFIRDNDVPQSPGYIYCQKCSGRFRPDEPLMRRLDPDAIFNTEVFNRLLQDCMQTGAEILG